MSQTEKKYRKKVLAPFEKATPLKGPLFCLLSRQHDTIHGDKRASASHVRNPSKNTTKNYNTSKGMHQEAGASLKWPEIAFLCSLFFFPWGTIGYWRMTCQDNPDRLGGFGIMKQRKNTNIFNLTSSTSHEFCDFCPKGKGASVSSTCFVAI